MPDTTVGVSLAGKTMATVTTPLPGSHLEPALCVTFGRSVQSRRRELHLHAGRQLPAGRPQSRHGRSLRPLRGLLPVLVAQRLQPDAGALLHVPWRPTALDVGRFAVPDAVRPVIAGKRVLLVDDT